MKDPLRSFSRTIPDSFERTPAFEAMRAGSYFVPTSWGNLASQLVEYGAVEPSTKSVCEYLNINEEQLAQSGDIFGNNTYLITHHFQNVRNNSIEDFFLDPDTQNAGRALSEYMTQFEDSWKQEKLPEKAKAIQLQIEDLASAARLTFDSIEQKGADQEIALLCMKRDAYHSGLAIGVIEFTDTMLSYKGPMLFSDEQILVAVGWVVSECANEYLLDEKLTRINDIIFSRDDVVSVRSHLKSTLNKRAYLIADKKIENILKFITPPNSLDFVSYHQKGC